LAIGVVAGFVLSLLAGMFVPIYTDEVGWRFQERAGFDGVDKMFNDMCGPNSLAAPPFFMWPVRYYSAFFNGAFADPLYVRLSGVGYALLWTLLVLWLIRRISAERTERATLAATGFGLMGLGVLPLELVWSRPEQPILLATTAALIIACGDGLFCDEPTPVARAWGRSLGILVLALIAISYHFKAVALIPVFLACIALASRGRVALLPRLATAVATIAAALVATRYWHDRVACPGDPIIAAQYAENNLTAQLVNGQSLLEVLSAALKNVTLLGYVNLSVPSPNPMSSWLPPHQLTKAAAWTWFRVMSFAWQVAFLAGLVCLAFAIVQRLRSRSFDRRIALAIALMGSAMVWGASQLFRNDYEASFVLPIMMLAILLALASPSGSRHRMGGAMLGAMLGLLAIGSQALVAKTFAPSLANANRQEGYIREQPFSVATFGFDRLKPDIVAVAASCGISGKQRHRALLVDDLTYFAFVRSAYLPQHRLGVFSVWNGTISDPISYLRSRGSAGGVVGCQLLPDDLRRHAKVRGKFCCLGPPAW
jgi:hypothetical protein